VLEVGERASNEQSRRKFTACSMMCFSVSEANVLEEQEPYNRCMLVLSICRRGKNIPTA
jgi:hypothetical protein